jgi:trigger factor
VQTTLTETSRFERKLTVQLDDAELETAKNNAARRLARDIKVPGFRPGKAPRRMVENAVGVERLQSEALEEALPEIVGDALNDAELTPATTPTVSETRVTDGGVEVDVTVTLWPKLDSVPAYDGRRIEIETPAVSDEDIDAQLERLRFQFAELEDVARPAVAGDFVLIDLTARRGDTTIEDASASDFLYEVGSGSFLPGLDAPLVGATAGTIDSFPTTLPAGFGEHAGESVEMQVLVKGVRARKLPELTDEWVGEMSEFDTIEELRTGLAEELAKANIAATRAELRAKLVEAVLRETDVILPEGLIGAEMDDLLHGLLHRLEGQGIGLDSYLEAVNQTQEQFIADLRERAQSNLGARILLDAVAEEAGLEIDAEEVDGVIENLAQASQQPVEEFRQTLVRGGRVQALVGDMLRQKALDHMVQRAEPVDGTGQPLDLFPADTEATADEAEAIE